MGKFKIGQVVEVEFSFVMDVLYGNKKCSLLP